MPHHVFCYPHIVVDFAIVDLENQADEVRKDGRAPCLGFDRRCTFASFGSDDGKAGECQYTSDCLESWWSPLVMGCVELTGRYLGLWYC